MRLTKNFYRQEFDCKDGTPVPQHLLPNVRAIAENLQVLRDHINLPIIVNSGYRTIAYNRSVGGAPNSQHLTANAADIRIKGIAPKKLAETIEKLISEGKLKFKGLGIYPTFVHVDLRKNKARW
ncbi:MAG TPA: D-Ala-D-Ala carboxypeptidase family metallohydrolase [Ferruginibacter sp.]|nr:D-Ala-D-Ala carboxypeptidase family metallohydrolase [Ferruginibacter sp.]HRQ20528.1 D-Ala-D-Ala carboxypeptidase family metallohydrolase [Ferruginibacter sp.]